MGFLIDTQVLVDLERSDRGLNDFLANLGPSADAAIASITASELLVGIYRADSEARRTRRTAFVDTVLSRVPVLPFDLEAARIHAQLWATLSASGQITGSNDLLIAATALVLDHAIVTRKVREFERVPGLRVQLPRA